MKHEITEFIPEELEDGTVYISWTYKVAIHNCCCGCKKKTVTPIDQGWQVTVEDDKVSISPSIGNFQFPCKSHYWIRGGEVVWC